MRKTKGTAAHKALQVVDNMVPGRKMVKKKISIDLYSNV